MELIQHTEILYCFRISSKFSISLPLLFSSVLEIPNNFNCYFTEHCRSLSGYQATRTFWKYFYLKFVSASPLTSSPAMARKHLRLFTFSNCFWEGSRAIEKQIEIAKRFSRLSLQIWDSNRRDGFIESCSLQALMCSLVLIFLISFQQTSRFSVNFLSATGENFVKSFNVW